jgi:HlyD family secretion protein
MAVAKKSNGKSYSPDLPLNSSGVVEDVILKKPGFIIQWGLYLIFLVLIAVVSASWFIQYPEVITGRATIIARNTPKEIICRQEGRLQNLFFKNGDTVKQNDIIGFIETTAIPEMVLDLNQKLSLILKNLKNNKPVHFTEFISGGFDGLGELQAECQQFSTAFQQYSDYTNDGYFIKKKGVLEGDLAFLQRNRAITEEQKSLLEKDYKLSQESYAINEKLLKDKVISKQDDRNEQSRLLSKQLTIPQINGSLLSNETQQREKQKEIADLIHTISQQKILFQSFTQTFQSKVENWIKNYVLISPVDGQINFVFPLQKNSFLSANKLLGFVNPLMPADYYAVVNLPQYNFAKIKTKQRVQLRFDAYPYTEFGYVNGQLNFISEFATDSGFFADIILPLGLITDQNKAIQYRNGLTAEARVITKDMRLLDRFYYNIKGKVIK